MLILLFSYALQRAILKFAAHTGANSIAGRFTPGTFTNQITRAFKEPRLLVVTDPRIDHQVCLWAIGWWVRNVLHSNVCCRSGRFDLFGAQAIAVIICAQR